MSVPSDPLEKLMDVASARDWRATLPGTLVFTNGVFDLLHPGHVDVLRGARQQGDALVVGINSDASVRRIKGPTRPINTQRDRVYVIAALQMVDAVVVFDDDTPQALIRTIHPDVLVKGGDYDVSTIVGASDVRGWGGRVVVIPLTKGHSTTGTIERLRDD